MARPSQQMSKYHIDGNQITWLKYYLHVLLTGAYSHAPFYETSNHPDRISLLRIQPVINQRSLRGHKY